VNCLRGRRGWGTVRVLSSNICLADSMALLRFASLIATAGCAWSVWARSFHTAARRVSAFETKGYGNENRGQRTTRSGSGAFLLLQVLCSSRS
jgi:hypothetical protein